MFLKPISSQTGNHPLELQLASTIGMEPILASTFLTLKWPGGKFFDIPKLIFTCTIKES